MSNNVQYFEVFKSLHRGGLSLYLNRRALLPLTSLPIGITFLTLALIRHYVPTDTSNFTNALLQIPADFCIGLFSSLIILIIMNAPRKKDTSKPVMFSMNLRDKRDILIAGVAFEFRQCLVELPQEMMCRIAKDRVLAHPTRRERKAGPVAHAPQRRNRAPAFALGKIAPDLGARAIGAQVVHVDAVLAEQGQNVLCGLY